MSQSAQQAVESAGEQFYVTHCTTSDSVLNNPGYTVRAASTNNGDVLDAAFRYPPYELPIDMWRDLPAPEAAPRRLARTEDPDGGVWAVHSAYLAKDTVDRDRSYFSHLMLFPAVGAADVLQSWGAEGWATRYPQGETKKLRSGRLPVGELVGDEALTAFLGDNPRGPTDLSVTVCPPRLRSSAAVRRELFARVMHGLVLRAGEANPSRRRCYVHAEPGLIALLLYGAVRLLPPSVTDGLTFSTFEPYHRNFRDYKLAAVVGTYLGAAEKGLDADLASVRGFALDTFHPARSSAELRGALPAGVADLVELAARGEWALLPTVRHTVGADASGLGRAGKAVLRARGLARVDAGQVSIDDLLALQGDGLAAEELRLRADRVWPLVKRTALDPRRDDVRSAFRDLIAEPAHVEELWEEAFDAVLREDFRGWESRWAVIRTAAGAERARKLLKKVVGSEKNEEKLSRLPAEVRARLRTACSDVGYMPPRPLLVPAGVGELEPLLSGPADCAGYTAFVLMGDESLGWLAHVPPSSRERMRKRAREFLFNAPPAALAAYVQAARPYLDTDSSFLDALFKPHSANAARLMGRLLTTSTLEPGDWLKLCSSVGLTQEQWGEFLLENDHLASLLVGLGGDGTGRGVWAAYLELLTPALVSPDLIEVEGDDEPRVIHEWERKVHSHLRLAAERLTKAGVKLAPALPEGGVARLFAANNLVKWVNDPAAAERDGWEEVKHACEVFEVDPLVLVSVAYKRGGFAKFDAGTEPQALAPVVALFKTCFPVDANFNTAGRAVREAVRLSRVCPEKSRGALQALLLHSCVPDIHYQAILHADWKEPLHPYAVARLNEWVSRAARKTGHRYVPPVASASLEAAPVESPFEDDGGNDESPETAPVIQKKGRRSGRGYKPGRRHDSKTWLWVTLVVGALAVALGVGAVVVLNKGKTTPTPPDAPKLEDKGKKAK